MAVILSGNNNQILMAAPGRPMLLEPLSSSVSPPVVTPPVVSPPVVASLSTIAGLAGWWDAGVATGILSPGGTALSAFGSSAGVWRINPASPRQ
jgi:hypothetical protein